jgi:hypothetical protein
MACWPPPAAFIAERKRIVAAQAPAQDEAKEVDKTTAAVAVWTVNQIAPVTPR